MNPLLFAARHGPYVLIAGLVAGLAIPPLADLLLPWLPHLVATLLFVSVLRIAPKSILGSLADLPRVALAVLGLQLALPLVVLAVGLAGGWSGSPVLLALLILASAPSISGSPNVCLMMGHAPEHALRLMVAGTALLPLTVIPVFWLMPELGGVQPVLAAALRLFLTITLCALAAIGLRLTLLKNPTGKTVQQLDGVSAILLAVFVIGLMPAVRETALAEPWRALYWMALVFAANFGAQLVMFRITRRRMSPSASTALSVIAGNRNVALFFVSLPAEITAPIMVFIGCYQFPMYMTPLLMRRLYRTNE